MPDLRESLIRMRLGVLLSLATLLFGFGLGAAFGAAEDDLKGYLKDQAAAALDSVYEGDAGASKAVTDKSWTYFKRAHLHANGLGTSSLAMILLLAVTTAGAGLSRLVAFALGLGSLGYSIFWLVAGMRAPVLGGTGAAKDSLEWLAIPSAGLCIVGLVLVILTAATARARA